MPPKKKAAVKPAALKRPAAAATEEEEDPPPAAGAGPDEPQTEDAPAAPPPAKAPRLEAAPNGSEGGQEGLKAVLAPISSGGLGLAAAAGDVEVQQAALKSVAEAILNRWDLYIGGQPHCVAELEAYVNGPGHADPYTHGDEGQNTSAVWYFHRHGGSFKSGSFKGMDLACGDGSRGVLAGLLFRSVRPLEGSPPVALAPIEGPCLVVDRILKLNDKASIADFVAGRAAKELDAEATEGLCMKPAAVVRDDKVWSAPRVGLVMRGDEAGKTHTQGGKPSEFVARLYRFATHPKQLCKFRAGFAVAAYLGEGATVDSLAKELSIPKMAEYAAAADKGLKEGAPQRFVDKKIATQPELCELVGACRAAALAARAAAP